MTMLGEKINYWNDHDWYSRGGSGDMICFDCGVTALSQCWDRIFYSPCEARQNRGDWPGPVKSRTRPAVIRAKEILKLARSQEIPDVNLLLAALVVIENDR